MGFWGVLWEIVKAVGPHAAPHVARAVAGRKPVTVTDRRAQAAAEKIGYMAQGLATVEERLAAAEARAEAADRNATDAADRVAAAEDKLSQAEAQFTDSWKAARKWMLALFVWNAVIMGILIYLVVVVADIVVARR
jgi:t-SNARE complex subunit (syntaxin)